MAATLVLERDELLHTVELLKAAVATLTSAGSSSANSTSISSQLLPKQAVGVQPPQPQTPPAVQVPSAVPVAVAAGVPQAAAAPAAAPQPRCVGILLQSGCCARSSAKISINMQQVFLQA